MTWREELAWAAGFFDGEGCASGRLIRGKYASPCVSVAQASDDDGWSRALIRFQAALGFGKIYGPYPNARSSTPIQQWRANSFEHMQAAVAMLWAFLGHRKQAQARKVLLGCQTKRGKP